MKRPVLITICVLTFISCRQPETLAENEKAGIIQEVRQTLENYYQDIRASGLTAEFKYLDTSSEFFWVPPGFKSSISYDSVTKILKINASLYKTVDNSFDTLTIIPQSRDLVSYMAKLRSTMTHISGKTDTFSLVETGLFIKRKDGWKLLNGQTTLLSN